MGQLRHHTITPWSIQNLSMEKYEYQLFEGRVVDILITVCSRDNDWVHITL